MVKLAAKPTAPHTDTFIHGAASGPLPDFEKVRAYGDVKDDEYFRSLVSELEPLSEDERKRRLHKYFRDKTREIKEIEKTQKSHHQKMEVLRKMQDAYEDLIVWVTAGPRLERADRSKLSDLRKSVATGHAMYVEEAYGNKIFDYDKHLFKPAEVMVVQHDWGSALSGGDDIRDASFKLPYDVCAFEFQWGAKRLIAFATEDNATLSVTTAIETKRGWLVAGRIDSPIDRQLHWTADGKELPADDAMGVFSKRIGGEIRAICIALDAEVAETEIVREAHAGNKGNASDLKPFHIVRLNRRNRSAHTLGDGTGRKKRLHFRRGHWRHYETIKVWVKWCLVGNPDLGFIDKEYRL